MCGIFGFAGFERPELLRRMADSIRHRGPDGEGFFVSRPLLDGHAPALDHRPRRRRPADLQRGPLVAVCFNGEIYNYVELVAELEEKGHRFRTHSDTEVIVHAYEQWGEECVDRFNGMFAFAVYDKNREELFVARDRAGQKPLYYWQGGGRFVFGSEIKALLECEEIERRPNLRAIDGYLALRYVPQPETLFDGIRVLPAGHWLRAAQGRARDPPLLGRPACTRARTGSEAEYQEEFEALFKDAVRLTLRSDVPVGAYLSGGIDSSLVVAAILKFKDKLKTFSIGFRSPIDETHEAAALAEAARHRAPRDPPAARALRRAPEGASGTSSGRSATR